MTSPRRLTKPEPFPSYPPEEEQPSPKPDNMTGNSASRPSVTSRNSKTPSQTASLRTRARTGSLGKAFLHSNPPLGFMHATGEITSRVPTLPEIRNGAFANEGWTHEGQMEHRGTNPHEIHARRVARTSSASTRTRKSSMSASSPAVIQEERHEFFPKRIPTMAQSQPPPPIEEVSTQPSVTSRAAPSEVYVAFRNALHLQDTNAKSSLAPRRLEI